MSRQAAFLALARLAGTAGAAQLRQVRRRAVRNVVLGTVAGVLLLLACIFAFAAFAVWLTEYMPLWAALLVVAGLLAMACGVLLLVLRAGGRTVRPQAPFSEALQSAQTEMRKVDPLTMVLIAVAAGFLNGKRGSK